VKRGLNYIVKTDLPMEQVSRIAVEIYLMWMEFAMGKTALNGRKLVFPSGRYAAAIAKPQQVNATTIAIVVDEDMAPEAGILETGHRAFDMKTVDSLRGRALPMHRNGTAFSTNKAGISRAEAGGLARVGPSRARPKMWAEARASTSSGYASFGEDSDPNSWWVPEMPAYSPAASLAALAKRLSSGG
jgi:hypothetical protein